MKTSNRTKLITQCGICEQSHLESLWSLPQFPFTEKYGIYDSSKHPPMDQTLCICSHCGHVQLQMQIDPEDLYTASEYSFRVTHSNTAQSGSRFFMNFFESIREKTAFQSLLDIGGNDLSLAKMVGEGAKHRVVVDPICSDQDGEVIEGIKVLGRFIEKVDFSQDIITPDLIFCRHVLEHIAKPKELLEMLFDKCDPEALYVFEIPCFDNLVSANRFDAIFHQHYHYFTLDTLKCLLIEAGGEYVAHEYNHQGSCGGVLLIAFRKAHKIVKHVPVDIREKKKALEESIRDYIHFMNILSRQLQGFNKKIYGYGAGLMLATLGYHLKADFSELICILDDDDSKDGMGYENIPVQVKYTGNLTIPEQSNFLITSLENTRPICQKILQHKPCRVLLPFII